MSELSKALDNYEGQPENGNGSNTELSSAISAYEDKDMSLADKGRMVLQGATLGWADEIIAGISAPFSEKTYDELVTGKRDKLKEIKRDFPYQSLGYEMGGSLGTGLLAAPFTMGGSLYPTIARTALMGGLGAATYGAGTGEGVKDKVTSAITNAPIGAVANPAIQQTLKGLGYVSKPLIDNITRKFSGDLGKNVENEIVNVIKTLDPSMTKEELIDEVSRRISGGEIIGDMSEATAQKLRAIFAKNTSGGKNIISEILDKRATDLRRSVTTEMTSTLREGDMTNNVVKAINNKLKNLEFEESAAYTKIFKSDANEVVSKVVTDNVSNILGRSPQIRRKIAENLKLKGLPPVFELVRDKKTKETTFKMIRGIDLETAEIVRRSIKGLAEKADSETRVLYKSLEKELRKAIDDFSPELAQVRNQWRIIKKTKDSFELGKRVFGRNVDDLEVDFENLIAEEVPELVAGFRAGVASAIKNKMESGSRKSFMGVLNDLDSKERKILEIIYPNDDLASIAKKIELAANAQKTKNIVKGGSITAITEAEKKLVGTGSRIADMASIASGDAGAFYRLARGIAKTSMPNLSSAEANQVAKLLMTEDANLFREAMTDQRVLEQLRQKARQITARLREGIKSSSNVGLLQTTPVEQVTDAIGQAGKGLLGVR